MQNGGQNGAITPISIRMICYWINMERQMILCYKVWVIINPQGDLTVIKCINDQTKLKMKIYWFNEIQMHMINQQLDQWGDLEKIFLSIMILKLCSLISGYTYIVGTVQIPRLLDIWNLMYWMEIHRMIKFKQIKKIWSLNFILRNFKMQFSRTYHISLMKKERRQRKNKKM